MGVSTIQRTCKTCQQPRPFEKQGVNHVLHFLLCIPTVGFWLIIWALLIFCNGLTSYKCKFCGQSKWL